MTQSVYDRKYEWSIIGKNCKEKFREFGQARVENTFECHKFPSIEQKKTSISLSGIK